MNVEAGPSGAVGLAGTAPVAVGEFSTIVNEGPVSASALENTMTIAKFKPAGEIVFKPSVPSVIEQAVIPSGIRQAEAVAAAAWEAPQANIAEAQKPAIEQPEAVIVPNVIPAWMPDRLIQQELLVAPQIVPQVEPGFLPWVEPAPALQVSPALEQQKLPGTESRISHKTATWRSTPMIAPQPILKEQEVEEVVTEKVRDEKPKESLEEEEDMEKRVFLEDERASAVRRFEIKQAIKLAFASVKDAKLYTVVGSLIARFLPGEHAGNRSSALKEKGPDGSYEETIEAIASSGEFSSQEQAEKRFEEIVAEKKPVKYGKNGTPVDKKVLARVFKYRDVKPSAAVEIFIKKIVKKKVQVPVGQAARPAVMSERVEPKAEASLEDYPELEEVFKS